MAKPSLRFVFRKVISRLFADWRQFLSLHSLTDSTVTNLNIKNTPVQAVSIAGCNGLTITGMTIDDSAGDAGSLGHNTDGFDIGTSSNVVIDGAKVYNQDDCVAVNSGTVGYSLHTFAANAHMFSRVSHSRMASAPAVTGFPLALSVVAHPMLWTPSHSITTSSKIRSMVSASRPPSARPAPLTR